ncbi:hypothetical protein [Erythrobacter tepidarius]|uniref:hypothetical protein n=1 Tax=Erythrobacter tepidarius TaxID=60454 RepID=UPI000A3BDCA5|nr:hypothetical protein [Erythrobacter tepidarius]
MALTFRALALAGALAGTTISAAPAAAAIEPAALAGFGPPVSAFDHSRFDPASTSTDWRCWGWRCRGWGHHGWRRSRVDAGDVLIGAAIIGGIAAIASANNRRVRERDVVIVERDRRWRDDTRRFDDRRRERRGNGASGLDNAVDQCLSRIERDVRVDTVDNVERTAAGWRVSGALFNGAPFQCRIGNDGRIESVDFEGSFGGGWGAAAGAADRADGQWSDDRYASARAAVGGAVRPDMAVSAARVPPVAATGAAMPAYPGGPIPGEVIPERIDDDIGG